MGWGHNGPLTIAHSDGVTVKLAQWSGITAGDSAESAELFLKDGKPALIDENGYPIGESVDDGPFPPFTGTHIASPQTGSPSGFIQGSQIHITVEWDDLNPKIASANVYTGTIANNGAASGTCLNTQNRITTGWHIVEHFGQGY